MPEITVVIAISLTILAASAVRGITGFGLAMTALPFISMLLSYRDSVVLLVLINLSFSILHLFRDKGSLGIKYLLILIVFAIAGVTSGVALLGLLNQEILRISAGSTIMLLAIVLLTGINIKKIRQEFAFPLATFTGGLLAGSISIGGPTTALILGSTGMKPSVFRYTMSVFFLVSYSYTSILFGISGYIETDNLLLWLICVPAMFLGFVLGRKLIKYLDGSWFRKIVLSVILIAGATIVYKGLTSIL